MGQSRFVQLLTIRADAAALLAPVRLRLLVRMLQGTCLLSVLLGVAYALLGTSIHSVVAGIVIIVAALVSLRYRPAYRPKVAWLAGLGGLALLWYEHNHLGNAVVPFATVLPALGTLVEGPYLGLALLLGVEGLLMHLGSEPDLSSLELFRLMTAGVTAYVTLGVVLGWTWGLTRAPSATAEARASLEETLKRRDHLAHLIFDDVGAAQKRLASHVAPGTPVDWTVLLSQVDALIERTERFKSLRQTLPRLRSQVPDFSAPVLRSLLLLFLTIAIPAAFYQAILRHGPPWPGALLTAVCLLALYSLRHNSQAPRWAAWAWVGAATTILSHDAIRDRGVHLTSTLVGWSGCVFDAALLLNGPAALAVAALGLVLTLDAGLSLPPTPALWTTIGGHLFTQSVAVLALLQAISGQKHVLQDLETKRAALGSALLQHRRYLGTLFHDIANPLGALKLICAIGIEGEVEPEDETRVMRLIARVGLLLRDSRTWLLDETEAQNPTVETVNLAELGTEIRAVFRERLESKRVTLKVAIDSTVEARCLPSALRESVVANLLSNAIKFSAPGSDIELRAWREAKRVHLELADRGPGLPLEVRKARETGTNPTSLPGTEGELGHGLGLTLVVEHLKRMGGSLELENREGGGLVARVILDAA